MSDGNYMFNRPTIDTPENFIEWIDWYLGNNKRTRNRKFHLVQDGHLYGETSGMVPNFLLMWTDGYNSSSVRLTTEVYNAISPMYKHVQGHTTIVYRGLFTLRQIWEFLL